MLEDQQGSSRPHLNNKEEVTAVSAGWRCERAGGQRHFHAAFMMQPRAEQLADFA